MRSGAHVRHRRRPPRSRDEMRVAIEARIRAMERLDDETELELAAALREIAPPITVEHVGWWQWRVTLETWEECGVTRRSALRRFRARYGLTPYVGHITVDYPKGPR